MSALYFDVRASKVSPLASMEGDSCSVTGSVISIIEKNRDYHQIYLKASSFFYQGKVCSVREKILINVSGSIDEMVMASSQESKSDTEKANLVGIKIQITGKVVLPTPQRNPGLFDYRLYLKTRGVQTMLDAETVNLILVAGPINPIQHELAQLRLDFLVLLSRFLNTNSMALLAGMLFGDISFLEESLYEAFQKNGTAHILSVSGIHISLIYGYLELITGRRKGLIPNAVTVTMLLFYAALSGFSVSVVRSVFMILVYIASKLLHRRYDMTASTAFTAMVLLLYQPYYLFSIGFQLSYLAVFTLSVVIPWVNQRMRALLVGREKGPFAFILRAFVPTVAIQLGMAPVTSYVFSYFSISGFFLNLPVIALSGVVIPIGLLLFLLAQVSVTLFSFFTIPADLICRAIIWLNQTVYDTGFAYVSVGSPSASFVALYYLFLFYSCSELGHHHYRIGDRKVMAVVAAMLLLSSILVTGVLQRDIRNADLIFLDVGQGDCLHIKTPEGKNMLIDSGGSVFYDVGEKIILPYLLKNGVSKLDLAIVSHLHTDHYQGLVSLSKHMEIKQLIVYRGYEYSLSQIVAETGLKPDQICFVEQGDRIRLGKEVYVDFLYPESNEEEPSASSIEQKDENENNLVVRLTYLNTSVMMTGDLTPSDEQKILTSYQDNQELLQTDILKVAHHGSRFSTTDAFLDEIDPDIAVIQVGKNNFGHPHPSIIEKLEQRDIMVYRNDQSGAIMVDCATPIPAVRTMIER